MTTKPPILASALPEGWIETCRDAVNHGSISLRAGKDRTEIEGFSPSRNMWMPITLPGGGTTFETAEQRDAVLRKMEGK